MPMNPRGSKACSICHRKKIKCDLAEANQPCTNCRLGDYTCRPHKRKRKHYALSPSPPREAAANLRQLSHDVPSSTYPPAPLEGNEETTPNANARGNGRQNSTTSPQSSIPQDYRVCDVPTASQSYDGRGEYLGDQVPVTEVTSSGPVNPARGNELADLDFQFLSLRKALESPPRTVRESLIDAYMERCQPWMPIVERRWLEENGQRQPSLLLLQAVFLAGSRVLSSPLVHISSEEFYERARALFFHGHERNTTLAIVAVCLLQWWNPTGPEKFSTSTSGFWVRIGVELAYQVGHHKEPPEGAFKSFRRRLWWTLVVSARIHFINKPVPNILHTRDSIISVGTGRPRTINLEDSNMKPPRLEDFAVPNSHASLFVAYVSICKQMGDITEAQRRQSLTPFCRQRLENALFRWLKELPAHIRIMHRQNEAWIPAPYNFEARQLAVPYFVCLILLYQSSNAHLSDSTVCLIASSFVVTIMEDFLSRDQLRYVGPVFAFYALAAGLVQLTGFRYEPLKDVAEHEFNVIKLALEELGKRWGSAHGALRALTRAKDTIQQQPRLQGQPPPLSSESTTFFADFGPKLCRMWNIGFPTSMNYQNSAVTRTPRQAETWDTTDAVGSAFAGTLPAPIQNPQAPEGSTGNMSDIYDGGMDDRTLFEDPLALAEGSWLFDNFDLQSILEHAVNTGI